MILLHVFIIKQNVLINIYQDTQASEQPLEIDFHGQLIK